MSTLNIKLIIPLGPSEPFGVPSPTFTHWLPIGKTEGIAISEDDIHLLLWFDIESAGLGADKNEGDIARHVNVNPWRLRVDVQVPGLDPEFASYVENRHSSNSTRRENPSFQERYDDLGARVLAAIIKRVNRLITYARVIKGQHWLVELESDTNRLYSWYAAFHATGQFGDGERFRFIPGREHLVIVSPPKELYIAKSDWNEVKEFVTRDQRTPLVSELLAGAKKLATQGFSRSALTEAITALEVAIADFSRLTPCKDKLGAVYANRINTKSLEKQVDRLGLSNSINYLLPLLIPDSVLPGSIISDCQNAVVERQNVVHRGQREVATIEKYISSIEKCCKILAEYCAEHDDG